uniref:Uncharacterized protein n=1 Tax=viral metagenome TaxID=1070528 RepID=A0A2V0R9C2_9ZZZZ
MHRLFSRSRWTWRYAHWVEVIPEFTLRKPIGTEHNPRSGDWNTATHIERTWATGTDYHLKHLVGKYNEFVKEIKDEWFTRRALAPIKDLFKPMSVIEIGVIPPGTGGLLWHTCISHKDVLANGADAIYMKWDHEYINYTSPTTRVRVDNIMMRREPDDEFGFEFIGSDHIPLEDLQLIYGLTSRIAMDGNDHGATGWTNDLCQIQPHGAYFEGVQKREPGREKYRLNTGEAIFEPGDGYADLSATPIYFRTWVRTVAAAFGFNGVSVFGDLTINRSSDPYKKLKHFWVHYNYLDIDTIRNIMVQAFIGGQTLKSSASTERNTSSLPNYAASAPPGDSKAFLEKKEEFKDMQQADDLTKPKRDPMFNAEGDSRGKDYVSSAPPEKTQKEKNKEKAAEQKEKKAEKKKKAADEKKEAAEKKKKNREASSAPPPKDKDPDDEDDKEEDPS